MSAILPILFLIFAAAFLFGALLALWRSLRATAAEREVVSGERVDELDDRSELLEEKQMWLRAIKDLELEHDLGKLSEEDYVRLDREYREHAKRVLEALDAQARPYRDQAAALIAKRVAQPQRQEAAPRRQGGKAS